MIKGVLYATAGPWSLSTRHENIWSSSAIASSRRHPSGRAARCFAPRQEDSREVRAVWMPAGQTGGPMTYSWDGTQHIVVAVGLGNYVGEYIAYRLPNTGTDEC